SSPARASASRPGRVSPPTRAWPSPTSTRPRWASGARSPLAPSDPREGTTGTTPAVSRSSSSCTSSTRTPDEPLASAFARRSVAARTTSSGNGSPTPQAWLRRRFSCSWAACSGAMCTSTKRPKPVLTPYVGVPSATTRSMSAREAASCSSARAPSTADSPPTATRSTSSMPRSCPESSIVAATGAQPIAPAPALPPELAGRGHLEHPVGGHAVDRKRRPGGGCGRRRRHQADELAPLHLHPPLRREPCDLGDDDVERRRRDVDQVHRHLGAAGARQPQAEGLDAGQTAVAFAHRRGDRARHLHVAGAQVDVERDEWRADAQQNGAGPRMEVRRAVERDDLPARELPRQGVRPP